MNESYLIRFPVDSDESRQKNEANGIMSEPAGQRQVTVVGLELDIDGSSFQYGKVRIECEATMFQLYRSKVELVLEEERPRLASVLGTRESSLGEDQVLYYYDYATEMPVYEAFVKYFKILMLNGNCSVEQLFYYFSAS